MEYRTKVSSNGQIVIPQEVMERYGFKKGTEIVISPLDENRLIIEKVPKLSEIFGFLGEAEAAKLLLEAREGELSAEKERSEELERKPSK